MTESVETQDQNAVAEESKTPEVAKRSVKDDLHVITSAANGHTLYSYTQPAEEPEGIIDPAYFADASRLVRPGDVIFVRQLRTDEDGTVKASGETLLVEYVKDDEVGIIKLA